MRRVKLSSLVCILIVVAIGQLLAGDRLSALSREDESNAYYVILRRVFDRTFKDDVVVCAISAVGTGAEEHATGILKVAGGYAAFSEFPAASVWSTEYDRFMADAKETCIDAATNKQVPCAPRKRERGLPKSYRGIKTEMKTRSLSPEFARRIRAVWQHRVEEELRAPILDNWNRGALGGLVHYYFTPSGKGGWAAAIGSNGSEHNNAKRMADLAIALQGYAVHGVSERELENALVAVEREGPK
jgi:hypothetical protein